MAHNLLLDVLPKEERERIAAHCETVILRSRMTLIEPDTIPSHVWFPNSGVCSSLVQAENGEAVEVALVGREGLVGISLVLGGTTNAFHVIVQADGAATRIAREPFTELFLEPGRPFCAALFKYANLYLTTVAQSAVCNRLHRIEQRLARWLLDFRDRTDSEVLPITHELLALMVGAYRPSVSNTLKAFEERGIISVGRGRVTILNEAGLGVEACECHRAIRRRTEGTLDQIRSMAA